MGRYKKSKQGTVGTYSMKSSEGDSSVSDGMSAESGMGSQSEMIEDEGMMDNKMMKDDDMVNEGEGGMVSELTREKMFEEEELRGRLNDDQYRVTQQAGTEAAFSGETWDNKKEGDYLCVVCDADLFKSDTKYDSGTGWPSFWAPVDEDAVDTAMDSSHGMQRVEAMCMKCGAHLGHVFPDGPEDKGGDRYCLNSASLKFMPMGKEGEEVA